MPEIRAGAQHSWFLKLHCTVFSLQQTPYLKLPKKIATLKITELADLVKLVCLGTLKVIDKGLPTFSFIITNTTSDSWPRIGGETH